MDIQLPPWQAREQYIPHDNSRTMCKMAWLHVPGLPLMRAAHPASPHEEASKDPPMHVPLLGLAGEGVAEAGVVHHDSIPGHQGWKVGCCTSLLQKLLYARLLL